MHFRINAVSVFCFAATLAACTDLSSTSQPRSVKAARMAASFDQVGSGNGTYICSMTPLPASISLYVGQSTGLAANEWLWSSAEMCVNRLWV
jgi:hypothetical protein